MRTSSPVASLAEARRHVAAGGRGLPGEAGARPADGTRRRTCGGQATNSVLEHRPGARWVRGGEEGQHEDVAVPEHMPAVGGTAETACSDRRLVTIAYRRHQMEESETNGLL